MRLELLKENLNLLNARSKYDMSCSIYRTKADCVALGAYILVYDIIEQLLPYFECALSNFRDIFNAY
jgi:hypothetical protein